MKTKYYIEKNIFKWENPQQTIIALIGLIISGAILFLVITTEPTMPKVLFNWLVYFIGLMVVLFGSLGAVLYYGITMLIPFKRKTIKIPVKKECKK